MGSAEKNAISHRARALAKLTALPENALFFPSISLHLRLCRDAKFALHHSGEQPISGNDLKILLKSSKSGSTVSGFFQELKSPTLQSYCRNLICCFSRLRWNGIRMKNPG
jgi:hypothetical protein